MVALVLVRFKDWLPFHQERALLSPPESFALQSVIVTADHGVSITKAYRTPIKIPGMMGS
jgi:hypothetical protein